MIPGFARMDVWARAQAACDDEIMRYPTVETGLLLFGRGGPVHIIDAVGAGPHAHRTAESFGFDADWNRDRIAEMQARGLRCIGEAHSHVIGPAIPSEEDTRAFETMRERRGVDMYAVILFQISPGTGQWEYAGTSRATVSRARRCRRDRSDP